MRQVVYNNILSFLNNHESFEIHFTPGWKGYETRSNDGDSEMVENIEEWFYDEFIHTLIDLGMDSEEMIFKFSKVNNELIVIGTFISYGHDYYRDHLYTLSDLIGEPIVTTLADALSIVKESLDLDEIEMRFDYSSKDSILKDLNLFYQDKVLTLSDQQIKVVTSFLSDALGKWIVGSGGEEKFRDLHTEVSVDEDYFSVKTYGKASFKLSTESICLI
jgi:hypothetical protein